MDLVFQPLSDGAASVARLPIMLGGVARIGRLGWIGPLVVAADEEGVVCYAHVGKWQEVGFGGAGRVLGVWELYCGEE
tara:strand:+ start:11373 stop:11606 length:234 start_codon:yes stop_codon:yes gene_type:complete